jgi:tetratricopeptide (TPR) repeat protein
MLEKLLVGMLVAGFAGALPRSASADDAAAAKVAFDEGRELFHAEQYAEASESFRRAYELKQSWKLFFNIAQCEAGARRYGLAVEAFERYLAEGGDEVPRERLDEVLAELTRLKALSGMLDISAPEGAIVRIDGIERGRAPLLAPVMVAAGVPCVLVVELDGKVLLEQDLRLIGGQTRSVEVEDGMAPESGPEAESDGRAFGKEEDVRAVSPLFWSGVGITLATGIAAGVLWGVMAGRVDDYERSKGAYDALDPSATGFAEREEELYLENDAALKDAETFNKAAIAISAVGGALLAGTIVVLALDLSKKEEPEPGRVALTPGGLRVSF